MAGLGMIRLDRWCSRIIGDILGKAISKQHCRGSTRIFCNPSALVSPLWVECRAQAHNVEVAIGDLFATRNPLKSQAARKVLSPISQHSCHVCAHSRLPRTSHAVILNCKLTLNKD